MVLMLMEAASTGPVYSTACARQSADRCGALQRFLACPPPADGRATSCSVMVVIGHAIPGQHKKRST